jgi:hypothetical protein
LELGGGDVAMAVVAERAVALPRNEERGRRRRRRCDGGFLDFVRMEGSIV